MKKLRATIGQHSYWKGLELYVDRIEGHLESDFSVSLENAKALLEAIGKEICTVKKLELGNNPSVNVVLKKAFYALGYSSDELVNKVSSALATIGQEMGGLRNEISPTSHGKSLEELRARNSKVDLLTREFLIDSTLVVAVFLIRAFEERRDFVLATEDKITEEVRLQYEEADEFNEFLDSAYGEFKLGNCSYTASEILFNVDYKAYKTEYNLFAEAEPTVEDGVEA